MMQNKPLFYLLLLMLGISLTSFSYADQETDEVDLGGGFTEAAPWKEGQVITPAYPQSDDLLKVQVDRVDMPFDFYLDSNNFSYSESEGVLRYTVVIRSNSGANNVLFEGLRCLTREYRTYAYGSYDDKFVKARTSKWTFIEENGFMAHRYNFYKFYMCNEFQSANSIKEIIRSVKYPSDFQGADEASD